MTPAQARELADDELDALIPTIHIEGERRVSDADRRSIARWQQEDNANAETLSLAQVAYR